MSQQSSTVIPRPRSDDRRLWDVYFAVSGYPAILAAHDLKLFPLLAEKPRTLQEVCEALQIAHRPAQGLLGVCTALELVQLRDGRYVLTPVAEDYLLDSSPTYFGAMLDFLVSNYSGWSVENTKKAIVTDVPQAYGKNGEVFTSHEEQAELARTFTRFMHSISMGPALAWPDAVDFSSYKLMLDIGGGSGAHSIGAALKWPDLHAVVFDTPPVCEVAQEFIGRYSLQERIRTQAGDLWNDPFPSADLHFYSQIYHDWPPEKCQFLTQKSFAALESGGRLVIHEMLYNDEKTGPFAMAALSINMLVWTEGEQYSGRELSAMLRKAGFVDIEVKPTWGYWSIVTGRKP